MLKINNKSSISDIVYFVGCISKIILLEIYVLHVIFVCICTSSIVYYCTNNLVFVFVFFLYFTVRVSLSPVVKARVGGQLSSGSGGLVQRWGRTARGSAEVR